MGGITILNLWPLILTFWPRYQMSCRICGFCFSPLKLSFWSLTALCIFPIPPLEDTCYHANSFKIWSVPHLHPYNMTANLKTIHQILLELWLVNDTGCNKSRPFTAAAVLFINIPIKHKYNTLQTRQYIYTHGICFALILRKEMNEDKMVLPKSTNLQQQCSL